MKNLFILCAVAFAIASAGCNHDPVSPDASKAKVNDPANPSSATTGSTSDACFDIPTPIMGTVTQGDITTVGGNTSVTVCWSYQTPANSYYTGTYYKPQGNKPNRPYGVVPTDALNKGTGQALHSPYEFWGGSQLTIVTLPSYSGHYDVERSLDGGATWTEIAETKELCYTDNNGGAGFTVGQVVQYRIEEKSNETKSGKQANDCTHHSLYSNVGSHTICGPISISDSYDATADPFSATVNCTTQMVDLAWKITAHNRTQNTCTGDITQTNSFDYTGNLCVTTDNGTTWTTVTWGGSQYTLSVPLPSAGTYTVQYALTSGTCDINNVVASSTFSVTADPCSPACDPTLPINNPVTYSIVGSNGQYPTSVDGNFTWNSATQVTVKASGQQWNSHVDYLGTTTNTCTGSTTVANQCGAPLYYCFVDAATGDPISSAVQISCTGNHYNIDGTNKINNPHIGVVKTYYLKFFTDAACTNLFWTVTFNAQ
ncbi:MAG: hypothetical protein Q8916_02430 [Bacteroidota bacterium]|nr:hypothetical protein [Bacteroidota bacterium]MDP4229243.1 hypothetical protein [Bacteroidota bacterium]MDP4235541.1 hypothetical protein [Bacteroidota bacterium]